MVIKQVFYSKKLKFQLQFPEVINRVNLNLKTNSKYYKI